MKIKMLRNVLVEGQHCAAGEVVEVEERLGKLLIQWRRAEAAEDDGRRTTDDRPVAGEAEVETATRPAGVYLDAAERGRGELRPELHSDARDAQPEHGSGQAAAGSNAAELPTGVPGRGGAAAGVVCGDAGCVDELVTSDE